MSCINDMSHDAINGVFWVSDHIRVKPVCSHKETNWNIEILKIPRVTTSSMLVYVSISSI